MVQPTTTRSLKVFLLIWFGQLISTAGTELTSFALGVWVYRETGSVTQLGLISLFTVLPGILIGPLAGALTDRLSRRSILIVSDIIAGLSTLSIALLVATHQLDSWHIYINVALRSVCDGFRSPALNASIALLVPPKHLGRANALMQTARAVSQIVPPVLAGILIAVIQLQGIIFIDFATFLFAVVTLLLFRIPEPAREIDKQSEQSSLWAEIAYGWRYIAARPGFLRLLILFALINFLLGIIQVLVTPLVLSVASTAALGSVLTSGGVGLLLGSVTLSIWGGPKRRMNGLFGFLLIDGLCIILGGTHPSVLLFATAAFGFFFGLALFNGCFWALWQSRVAADVQGRVFATLNMIMVAALPLGYLAAGPLADRVFEPLMSADGAFAGSIGLIIGVGPGRGIGLIFITLGLLMVLATARGYLDPRLRLLEQELPEISPATAASMGKEELSIGAGASG